MYGGIEAARPARDVLQPNLKPALNHFWALNSVRLLAVGTGRLVELAAAIRRSFVNHPVAGLVDHQVQVRARFRLDSHMEN